jgi:hypothetical protein
VRSAETMGRSMEISGLRFWSCRLPIPGVPYGRARLEHI